MEGNIEAFIGTIANVASILGLLAALFLAPVKGKKRKALVWGLIVVLAVLIAIRSLASRKVYGDFEWCWAGEGWMGIVTIEEGKDGSDAAKVQMKQVMTAGATDVAKEVMVSTEAGEVEASNKSLKLKLPVRKLVVESGEEKWMLQVLEAELSACQAYAGLVKYVSPDRTFQTGDMVLIKYKSGKRPN